jgi:hypothetical protein
MHEQQVAAVSPAAEGAHHAPGPGRPLRRRGRPTPEPLSPESAASVGDGVIAVLRHGVRYLPIVDDGTLVGILPVGQLDWLPAGCTTRRIDDAGPPPPPW